MKFPASKSGKFLCALAASLLGAALFAGCATSRPALVQVTALARSDSNPGYTYTMGPGRTTSGGDAALRAGVESRVREALATQGFLEVEDPAAAEVVVSVDYEQGAPFDKVTSVTRPEIVQPSVFEDGLPFPIRGRRGAPRGWGGQTVVMADSLEVRRESTKRVTIQARENTAKTGATGPAPQVWIVEGVIDDGGKDLEACIEPMIQALAGYIGSNAEAEVRIVIPAGS